MQRNKLYIFLFIACLIGYLWIYLKIHSTFSFSGCLFKKLTTIPCPSCGSTRSMAFILDGRFGDAFSINPFGYIVAPILFITPIWIIIDFFTNRNSLLKFYTRIESFLKKPIIAYLTILLILINWIWNITKYI